jgi:hypothetical protein
MWAVADDSRSIRLLCNRLLLRSVYLARVFRIRSAKDAAATKSAYDASAARESYRRRPFVRQEQTVNKLIGVAGNVAAVAGILLCVLTVAARILGVYEIAGIDVIAGFTVGIGSMVFACLAKLHVLTVRLTSS